MAMTRRQWAQLAIMQAAMFVLLAYGGFAYTNYVDQQRARDERRAAAARAEQAELTRRTICQIAIGQAEAFRDATSPTGQQARDGWLTLAQQMRCG